MASSDEDLLAAQRLLGDHIAELSHNSELVNVHCFAIDNLSKISERNIEAECDKLIEEVCRAKKELLSEFRASAKSQLSVARKNYISIAAEKRLCEDLNGEIGAVIRNEDEKEDVQGDRIKKLCQQIKETCTKRTQLQQTNNSGPTAAEIKQKLFEIASRHLGQMGTTLSRIMEQKKQPDTLKTYRLKPKNQSPPNQARKVGEEQKHQSPPRTTKLKRHYIVRGSPGSASGPSIAGSSGSTASAETAGSTTSASSSSTVRGSPQRQRPTVVVGYKVSDKQKEWRRRQIQIAKGTEGYRNLVQMHPAYLRDNPSRSSRRKCFPAMVYPPDVHENIGKKRWAGKYRQWRLFLHGFTKNADVVVVAQ